MHQPWYTVVANNTTTQQVLTVRTGVMVSFLPTTTILVLNDLLLVMHKNYALFLHTHATHYYYHKHITHY